LTINFVSSYWRAIKFNPHHLVLWSILGLSQWVYVRDDMSKGLKIMSLGVINHGITKLHKLNTAQQKHVIQYKTNTHPDKPMHTSLCLTS
jgi:hypothetical protein